MRALAAGRRSAAGLAVILPLSGEDHGFEWGTDREHILLRAPTERGIARQLRERIEESGASLPSGIGDDVPALVRAAYGPYADFTIVDLQEGVTDDWPSAGQAEAWGDDVWLGLADYLSYLHWITETGEPDTYTLRPEDVSGLDPEDMREAAGYLPTSSPIRILLESAAEAE